MRASLLLDSGAMRKTPMMPEEIARRRDEIAAHRGPWRADNLLLARNVYTMGEGAQGQEARVRRAVQTVLDLSASRVKGLRILDLGCGEGGFALELGKQGAEVVAIEGRAALAEKAEFARDALGLRHVSIVRGDVRRLSAEEHGFFDVVLALGILDRLDAPAVFDVAKRVGSVCKGFVLVEARLAARPRASHLSDGIVFRGAPRREHAATASRAERLAAVEQSLDNEQSFLLTRRSILSLLARSGFTSIAETLDPDAAEDAPCFAAFKGRRVALQTAPQSNAVLPPGWGEAQPATPQGGIAHPPGRSRR
jgi:SAM-dependent methyltransferase